MVETLIGFLGSHGYLVLVAVGFAEYAGAPIASVPVLVAAGGLGTSAGLGVVPVVASAALGGLVADLGWYSLVRWRGAALVDVACGLTSNPDACVLGVESRVARLGPAYVVPSKFVPGAGNLVAAAASLAGMGLGRFVVFDGLALLLWAGAWTTLGRLLASEVHAAVELAARYQRGLLLLAVGLVVAAGLWRSLRVAAHRGGHPSEGNPEDQR